MDISKIHCCRECRPSHHLLIKNLKNAVLENPANMPVHFAPGMRGIAEDYIHRNVIKKPEHITGITRMATERKFEWKNGRVLTVSFMGGSKAVRERVAKHAKRWMDFANIEFQFLTGNKKGDIRVTFDKNDGSWSYVGTDLLSYPKDEPTMNLGWLKANTEDEEYSRVVLHEFGHSLGCIHEHERPDNGIPWDKPKVYEYYKETNDWSKEDVDNQVFDKYNKNMIRSSKLDRKSIMMYAVPNELTIGNYQIGWNSVLSKSDKEFISKLYPKH